MADFNPNLLTFEQGLDRIRSALGEAGLHDLRQKVITSRDPRIRHVTDKLETSNVPKGFKKWQLPVYQDGPTQMFISVGAPDVEVASHSHDEGDGFRYIASGSVVYDGHELTAGDWMFIPKGMPYSLKIGAMGATMFYCHQCCCG
jgi:hypothetical protein